MAVPTITQMPAVIESGDTLRVKLSFGDYPATTYTAALKFNIPGSAPTSVTGTASGTEFVFTLSAAASGAMAAGLYDYAVRVTEIATNETATAQTGTIQVLPNLAGTVTKTPAEQALAAAELKLVELMSLTISESDFNGQRAKMVEREETLKIIERLKSKVAAERDAQAGLRGQGKCRSIRPYFTPSISAY